MEGAKRRLQVVATEPGEGGEALALGELPLAERQRLAHAVVTAACRQVIAGEEVDVARLAASVLMQL
jgi:hypothetical protein